MTNAAEATDPTPGSADADAQGDYAVLTEQAEALRRAGRADAADQLLAWRDLHAMRVERRGKAV